MKQTNIYSLILNDLYWNKFNSIKNYQSSILNLNNNSYSGFTKDFRTIQVNLGRAQGATTAIADFINEHRDLNFIYITCHNRALDLFKSFLFNADKDFESKVKIKFNTYKNLRGFTIQNDVDIVFLDVASSVVSDEDRHILARYISPLNSEYNKNQWVIKFG